MGHKILWGLWVSAAPRAVQYTDCSSGGGGPSAARWAGAQGMLLALDTKPTVAAQCYP